MSAPPNYWQPAVAAVVRRYPGLVAGIYGGVRGPAAVDDHDDGEQAEVVATSHVPQWAVVLLIDLDNALTRVPPQPFAALTLVGLEGKSTTEAGRELGISRQTVRRHYVLGIEALTLALNDPDNAPAPMRAFGTWRAWVLALDDATTDAPLLRPTVGRRPTTDRELEEAIVRRACAGATQRQVAAEVGVSRDIVRRVLIEYGHHRRRGPVPAPDSLRHNWAKNPTADELIRKHHSMHPH